MSRHVWFLAPLLMLCGCLSSGTTKHSWSCRPAGQEGCVSISQTDHDLQPASQQRPTPAIFGGRVASWWAAAAPGSVTRPQAPRRETDQTMRIVLAPYIDGQGDYHERSEVYAVMRKAQWWIAPPVAATSSPVAGTPLPPQSDVKGEE